MTDPATIRRLMPIDAALFRAIRLEALARDPKAFSSTLERESAEPLAWFAERLGPGDYDSPGPSIGRDRGRAPKAREPRATEVARPAIEGLVDRSRSTTFGLNSSMVFGAWHLGTVIGTAGVYWTSSGDAPGQAQLWAVYVRAGHRGAGVGQATSPRGA